MGGEGENDYYYYFSRATDQQYEIEIVKLAGV